MSRFDDLLTERLDLLGNRGLRRHLRPGTVLPAGRIRRGGRDFVNFSANDYLGLSLFSDLRERAADWALRYGTGAGASRLVTGTSKRHLALESRIAAFKQAEAAVIFASGWQANAGIIPALLSAAGSDVLLFTDRLNHASLHHGCQAAGVRQIRFRHNDLDHLESLLIERHGMPGRRFIITESVFSMDGDRADVRRLIEISERHEAFLYLDEAHATGVLGPDGAGLSVEAGGVDLVMGTFSKAFGAFGAYVAGSRTVIDYLVNTCGGLIYTTAPPPAMLGAIDAALDWVRRMDAERAKLAAHGERLRSALRDAGFDTGLSTTQIVPVIFGTPEATLAVSHSLEQAGIIASAIRPPTVPEGSSRLRIALSAAHDEEDVEMLIEALVTARDRL